MGDSVIQVRTCKRCGQNLTFDANVLERFVACPFCGTFFPKVLPSIESGTIEAELKKLAEEAGYSVSRFCELYKKFYNSSPIADLIVAIFITLR